jgi:hypothetical protein
VLRRDDVERVREFAPPRRGEPERVLVPRDRERAGADGTFAPFSRASLSPIAIACLRLVTLRPLRPLRKVPCFRLCMASRTVSWAFCP